MTDDFLWFGFIFIGVWWLIALVAFMITGG